MLIYKGRMEKSTGMLLEGGARLRSTPTSQYRQPYSGIEDYELKERITLEFSGGGDDYH